VPAGPDSIAPERLTKVDAARQAWIRRLVDLSRRNNLLYFRDLKIGTLDLTDAPHDAMQSLLQSGSKTSGGVGLGDLVPFDLRKQAAAALTEIAARARGNFEERGLDTLFLALGLASWAVSDGGREAAAPVLLVPLQVTQTGVRNGQWQLRRAGEVKINEVLVHALREEHGIVVEPDALLLQVLGDDEGEAFDLAPVFKALALRASQVPGFTIAPRWIVGNFAFQKMAIVKDLQRLLEALARHDIVAGIAGDRQAADMARGDRTSVDPATFDREPPDHEFLIRDADSSQQQAIAATLRNQNGVISGPPGTGKSQTIANLIAEMVARRKTVLFVAEKRAALDVVLNRLSEAGLGHLCLDCHGAELTRRHIAEQLQASIERVRDAPAADADALHRRFAERRDRLNTHVRAMHQLRQPSGLSVYALYGRVLRHPSSAISTTRLPRLALNALDERAVESLAETLRALATLAPLVIGTSPSPWACAVLASRDDVRSAIDTARRIAHERWPQWQCAAAALLTECPAKSPTRISEVRKLLEMLIAIEGTLAKGDDGVFRADLDRLAEALAPATSSVRALWAALFDATFRQARRDVRSLHFQRRLSGRAALDFVCNARQQLEDWRRVAIDATSTPVRLSALAAAAAAWRGLEQDLQQLAKFVRLETANDELSLADLADSVARLAADTVTPAEVLTVYELEKKLDAKGVAPVLREIRERRHDPRGWPDVLRSAWLQSCLEEIQLQEPSIASFRGSLHDEIASEFRQLDKERLVVAVDRVQREHAKGALKARNQHGNQNNLVAREAAKRTRHLPLRRLFAEAPDVLLALRPCWMASPLSVSQLMPGDRPLFDLVIFDEASQVLPEDAVTSLLRGRQAVIAGDSRQLPPTTFFAAGTADGDSDVEDEGGTEGFQSILDVMSAFLSPAWSLDWHYRSRDEALIAFSNHCIYNDRLVTFPGPGMTKALRHELVSHVLSQGGQEMSATREVQRVVELVVEHADTRPGETLGVITMGIEHAKRIEMALARARESRPDLDDFFAQDRSERFFVKNLERVQGDERDAIILSIGYGKNEAGDLLYRFGPLLQEGGERRLNVAITRARHRMTVVSSFGHNDLRPDYPKLGVRLLRGFLEYAASEGNRLDSGRVTDLPLNDFEQAVCDELTRQGLTLVGQVGTSRYRIDLVAMHPTKPGRYVLAIECDGASYHSAPTARDRDRLRQQQLENLGWRFHRVWSTDWFLRRDEEVRRALAAFREAVAHADALDRDGLQRQPVTAAPVPEPRPAPVRGARPSVQPGRPIDTYSQQEMRSLVQWVLSDGTLPTDEEIVTELTRELGFQRRGTKIVAALTAAIRAVRGAH
jgi:very-short-patch-repair endonuclease